jgi:hypothetical protein
MLIDNFCRGQNIVLRCCDNRKQDESKNEGKQCSTQFISLHFTVYFKATAVNETFFKLFINNQNYFRFYKLICWFYI